MAQKASPRKDVIKKSIDSEAANQVVDGFSWMVAEIIRTSQINLVFELKYLLKMKLNLARVRAVNYTHTNIRTSVHALTVKI